MKKFGFYWVMGFCLFLAGGSCVKDKSPFVVNSGSTWEYLADINHKSIVSMQIDANGYIYASLIGDGLYKSTDAGRTWNEITRNLPKSDLDYYRFAINQSNHIIASGLSTGLLKSTDLGESWTLLGLTDTLKIIRCAFGLSGEIFLGTNGDGILLSTDDGITWEQKNQGLPDLFVQSFGFHQNGDIYAGVNNWGVYKLRKGENDWQYCNTGLSFAEIFRINTYHQIYVFDINNGIAASKDNGATWHLIYDGPRYKGCRDAVIDFSGNIVFIGWDVPTNKYSVFYSNDDGNNWQEINRGLETHEIYSLLLKDQHTIFAGTNNGVYQLALDF